jgi:phospho-N-acetylmuramoyl-pentapeptide-transferase
VTSVVWAGGIGLGVAYGSGPVWIPVLRRLKFGQQVREVGPQAHLKKQGTPTMGGLLFLAALPLSVAILVPHSVSAWALVFLTWGYGAIGFVDDFLKVALKRPLGLKAREKLLGQVLVASAFTGAVARWSVVPHYVLPFHWGTVAVGWWYGPLSVLAVLGAGNAVNITDGLDGLAAGASAIAFIFFAVWGLYHHAIALEVFALTLVGGLVGFLRYNLHPAQVFMGDTGSLALGAGLAGAAIVSGTTLLLPLVGVLFVIETLSVIIQVLSFRLTGRRVFRMSPLHHHFELVGWSEEQVVTVFWVISLIGAVLAWW